MAEHEAHANRLRRIQELMGNRGIELMIIGPSADFRYFTGHHAKESERLTALLIPSEGEPSIIVPQLEAPLFQPISEQFSLEVWRETEHPTDRIANIVQKTGAQSIAINDQLWSGFLIELQDRLPNHSFRRGIDVLRSLRSIKDASELAIIREASRRTDDAWNTFVRNVRFIGRSEREVAEDLTGAMADNGIPDVAFCIVASGPNGASPHHHTGDRAIQAGDPVVIDFGGIYQGYYSDVTRTPVVGRTPDSEFERAYHVVLEAQQAAFTAIAPGVPCQDIDRTAREVITDAGFGEYFIHRVGHGLGMTAHEDPYLVEGNQERLQSGMVVSDEPGIYIPGRWGIRIEDTVVVTDSGRERYNHALRELTIVE